MADLSQQQVAPMEGYSMAEHTIGVDFVYGLSKTENTTQWSFFFSKTYRLANLVRWMQDVVLSFKQNYEATVL